MENKDISKKADNEKVNKLMAELEASLNKARELKQRIEKEKRADETKRKILGGVVFNHIFNKQIGQKVTFLSWAAECLSDADFEFLFGFQKPVKPATNTPPPTPPTTGEK